MPDRRPIAVIAWSTSGARARDLATDLGATCFVVATFGRRSPVHTLAGYVVDAVRTVAFLVRQRPRAIIVQNPPIVPALVAAAYSRRSGAVLVLDSHTGAFGLKGDRAARAFLPVHRALARRAAAVLVPSSALAGVVRAWGGRPLVLFDPPPRRTPAVPPLAEPVATAVYAGLFARDEPVGAMVEAARLLRDVHVVLLGDPDRLPRSLVARAPANATFGGLLDPDAYLARLASADIVVALTSEPTSTMRVACEAVWLSRPLVVSASAASRAAFPHATHVANSPQAIADGVRADLASGGVGEATAAARASLAARYAAQRSVLVALLAEPGAADSVL